jgi:hypothetical protein
MAFSLPHRGHSAFANISKKAPRADGVARMTRISSTDIRDRWQNSCETVGGSAASASEHSLELRLQGFMLGRESRYPYRTFMRR